VRANAYEPGMVISNERMAVPEATTKEFQRFPQLDWRMLIHASAVGLWGIQLGPA